MITINIHHVACLPVHSFHFDLSVVGSSIQVGIVQIAAAAAAFVSAVSVCAPNAATATKWGV
jgi:hypothetical protein